MSNNQQLILLHDGEIFTPYYFYTRFLKEVAEYYNKKKQEEKTLSFSLTDGRDLIRGRYRIDPAAIPLLLSLSQQLRLNQVNPIILELLNVPSTNALLEFLYRSDFFFVSGDNTNPNFPLGKGIFSFDKKQLGGFMNRYPRPEHKVRCYSLSEEPYLIDLALSIRDEDDRRDRFVEYYAYRVGEHFHPLLEEFSSEHISFFVDVLSELITNGVIHSGTDVFALMFSDRYSIKFSISDNGIGFSKSLSKKEDTHYFKKFELSKIISDKFKLQNDGMVNALLSIFEALFFSMIKSRVGLFDLLLSVVMEYNGYFRLHNDYAQVVVSVRMRDELVTLGNLRKEIRKLYSLANFGRIEPDRFHKELNLIISRSKVAMIALFGKMWQNFDDDVRFSAIRFFPVRFRGVHIETEISK